jgi:D-beta-D-heptose 7-phosphate kinase/D-beta-D-heptose 1-phosphate adenosyltransferase
MPLERMADEVEALARQGLKVGFTNGCFDILHKGHVAYLAQARSWCDRLVVALNTDASVAAEGRGPAGQRPGQPRRGAGGLAAWTWWRRSTTRPRIALIERRAARRADQGRGLHE